MTILNNDKIALDAQVAAKKEAIELAGSLLVEAGHVDASYIEGMLAREATMSTYVGSGVAIPHGQRADLATINSTGISVVQIRSGIRWNEDEDDLVHLVIGLATSSSELEEILRTLVGLLQESAQIERLVYTDDPQEIIQLLSG